jgi:hypothetical protein
MLNESNDYEELKRWDIKKDKKYLAGNFWEHIFADIITDEMKAEIKSELKYSWGVTGNIYIEIRQHRQGKWEPSGLSVTTAEYWVHILKTEKQEEMHAGLIFKTQTLKERLRYLFDNGMATLTSKLKTHDGAATQAIIVDARYLLYTDEEIQQYRAKIEEEQKERIKKVSKNNSK